MRTRMEIGMRLNILMLLAASAASDATAGPSATPAVFAPGIVSGTTHDSAPAFTPDGLDVIFGRSSATTSTLLMSHRAIRWGAPTPAPFSGVWNDMEPAIAPDGSYAVFVSNRPATANGVPLDG